MSNLNEVLRLLKIYLEQNTMNNGFWSISNIKDIAPVVQAITVLVTAIVGLIKYYRTKNIEIYEKRLKEVYAPLYMRLVKQEYLRSIFLKDLSTKDAPIITITKREKEEKYESVFSDIPSTSKVTESSFLDRNIFISIMQGINAGLASQKLLTLIALYESSIYIETISKGRDEYFENGINKLEIELDLYHEIMKGYQECYNKLKLDKKEKYKNWDIINNEFVVKYVADKAKLKEFRAIYNNNPEKFE